MNRWVGLAMGGLALAGAAGSGAAQSVNVTGTVRGQDGAALTEVVVHLRERDTTVSVDGAGVFRFVDVTPGQHVLTLAGAGYALRQFRFTLSPDQLGDVDVGVILLEASDDPVLRVTGVVRDQRSGEAVPAVSVRIEGRVVGVTGPDGRFDAFAAGVDPGESVRLDARRIGFEPFERDVTVPTETAGVDLDIALTPLPVALEDINVEGEEVELRTGRLGGFYRRRDLGLGNFFTRADIREMGATRVSDVIRRVPGAVIITEESIHQDPFGRPSGVALQPMTSVQFQRRGFARAPSDRPCRPLVFVNEQLVRIPDIDGMMQARHLAGMEVYASAAQVPAEYNRLGSECGVIVMWTDAPFGGSGRVAGFEIGVQFGARVSGDGPSAERVGVQMVVPLFWRVEFRPSFAAVIGGEASFNAGWQATGILAMRPLPAFQQWYLGAGAGVRRTRSTIGGPLLPPRTETWPVLTNGVSVPIGPVRPFLELQMVDPFGGLQWHTVFGLTVRTQRDSPPLFDPSS